MVAMFSGRLMLAALVTLAYCANALDPSCHAVSGPKKLRYRAEAPCVVTREDDYNVVFSNAPGNNLKCFVSLWTREPNYMEITILELNIGATETIKMKTILASRRTFTVDDVNVTSQAPVTRNTFSFAADSSNTDSTFRIRLTSKDSGCSVVCKKAGIDFSMPLFISSYGANTYCQVSITTAAANLRVKANFTKLDVGYTLDKECCLDDFIAITTRGSPAYNFISSQKFCGLHTDLVVISEKKKLNLLFNGKYGGLTDIQGGCSVFNVNG